MLQGALAGCWLVSPPISRSEGGKALLSILSSPFDFHWQTGTSLLTFCGWSKSNAENKSYSKSGNHPFQASTPGEPTLLQPLLLDPEVPHTDPVRLARTVCSMICSQHCQETKFKLSLLSEFVFTLSSTILSFCIRSQIILGKAHVLL